MINYKGKLGTVQFTDYNERTLRLWLVEDGGINKWSTDIYELPLPGKHACSNTYQIVGMTCDIVLPPVMFTGLFYVFY